MPTTSSCLDLEELEKFVLGQTSEAKANRPGTRQLHYHLPGRLQSRGPAPGHHQRQRYGVHPASGPV
jgi:hypothetical protein